MIDAMHLQLNEILQNEYGFSSDEATVTCSSYLKKFRQCPDNVQYSLDLWRLHLFNSVLDDKYQHQANEIFQKWLQLRYKYLYLTPEIQSMLIKLKRNNYLLAIISNGPSNAQWEKINKMNLQSLFDLILISGDLPWEKPNKNIFHQASTYLGLQPYQCAMIGDNIDTDIIGGIEANLGCTIWLPLLQTNTRVFDHASASFITPNLIIHNITDLSNFFLYNDNDNELLLLHNTQQHHHIMIDLEEDCNSNGSDGS